MDRRDRLRDVKGGKVFNTWFKIQLCILQSLELILLGMLASE